MDLEMASSSFPIERRGYWEERLRRWRPALRRGSRTTRSSCSRSKRRLVAILHTPVPEVEPSRHLGRRYIAVRIGDDTDTVATIAGSLLGRDGERARCRCCGGQCCMESRGCTGGPITRVRISCAWR